MLISGNGSNLQSILDAIAAGEIPARVVAVLSNQAEVYGLERAQKAGIPAITIKHDDFPDRKDFDQELQQQIDKFNPDLIVLAGFMRILTTDFVCHYQGRMLNIHPSLLPMYQGLHTHKRVLQAQDKSHGCTVHFVTEELDGGPVIAQSILAILDSDTEQTLAKRVQLLEHQLYPKVINAFCEGKINLTQAKLL